MFIPLNTEYEVSQKWGENPELYKKEFGINGHNGWDFVSYYGCDILAAHDGIIHKIIWDGEHSTKGNGVYIRNNEIETIYWHLSKINCSPGQQIRGGEKIGEMGNSGKVRPVPTPQKPLDGTHLHFGIRPIKNNQILYPNNGFDGYVDPEPYLENNMLLLYGNSKTKNQYVKGKDGLMRLVINGETLGDLHEAGVLDKDSVVWLSDAEFATYKLGKTFLTFNND